MKKTTKEKSKKKDRLLHVILSVKICDPIVSNREVIDCIRQILLDSGCGDPASDIFQSPRISMIVPVEPKVPVLSTAINGKTGIF